MKFFNISVFSLLILFTQYHSVNAEVMQRTWQFQSIDTMKYSRDLAREKLKDKRFDSTIEEQISNIAETGVTHVAIATPYDEEFIAYLTRWVKAARKYDLQIWFRGNFSGWEEWFGYKPISRAQHLAKTKKFVESHPELFEDGDIFSPCPECENGGPGDPRVTKDVKAYRKFLIDEHKTTQEAFQKINKRVATNYNSMNGDVALLIMDKPTTKALGGVVVVDHYVKEPAQLAEDIRQYAQVSGGKVVLGEFGAPIPDIHGKFTHQEQNEWLEETLTKLAYMPELIGMNYWTYTDSSTQLWLKEGDALPAAETLKKFYTSKVVKGTIVDELGNGVGGVRIKALNTESMSDDSGEFYLPYLPLDTVLKIESKGYKEEIVKVQKETKSISIQLTKKEESWWFRFTKALKKFTER